MAEQATVTEQAESTRAGKYLTFALAEEEYGLEILKVREIISMSEITSVPKTPEFVKGVINLRGKVIPVIDLRLKFAIEELPYTDETRIIVVDVNGAESQRQPLCHPQRRQVRRRVQQMRYGRR